MILSAEWNLRREGTGRVAVHGSWQRYRDSGNAWQPIVPVFADEGSAYVWRQGPMEYAVSKSITSGAVVSGNNRWDVFGRQTINAPATEFAASPLNVSPVAVPELSADGSQVLFRGAWPGLADLRYTVWRGRAPRVTREAVVSVPAAIAVASARESQRLEATWRVRAPGVLVLVRDETTGFYRRPKNADGSDWTGAPGDTATIPGDGAAVVSVPTIGDKLALMQAIQSSVSILPAEFRRGNGFTGPRAWYYGADGKRRIVPIEVAVTVVSTDEVEMTKRLPLSLFQAALAAGATHVYADDTQTVYPDANPETTSCDGTAYTSGNLTWAQHYSGGPTYGAFDDNMSPVDGSYSLESGWAPENTANKWKRRWDALTFFDLTSLTGTVASVDLVMELSQKANWSGTHDPSFALVEYTGSETTGLTTSSTTSTRTSSTRLCTDLTYAGMSVGSITRSLNATGIAAVQAKVGAGLFRCATQWARHADNSELTHAGDGSGMVHLRAQWHGAERTGTATDPRVVITFEVAGGSSQIRIGREEMLARLTVPRDR